MNCVENLPVFAAVVLTAVVADVSDPRLGMLSMVFLGARVMQTLIHISSGGNWAINVRFTFYLAQLVVLAWMVWMAASSLWAAIP